MIYSIPSTCVLSVIPDKNFNWLPHQKHILYKVATQTNVLSQLTALTGVASLWVLRLLSTSVVCPAITIVCHAW